MSEPLSNSGDMLLEHKPSNVDVLTFDTWRLSIGDGMRLSVGLADRIRNTYTKARAA